MLYDVMCDCKSFSSFASSFLACILPLPKQKKKLVFSVAKARVQWPQNLKVLFIPPKVHSLRGPVQEIGLQKLSACVFFYN